jgi:hypothetical protein
MSARAAPRQQRPRAADHAEDLRSMQRAALGADGTLALLRWLARRVDGHAVLLDAHGNPVMAVPGHPDDLLHDAAADITRVVRGRSAAASVETPSWWARMVGFGGDHSGPALLVSARTPLGAQEATLIADAAVLLQLRLDADSARKKSRALHQADPHIREAVLHLLMSGQVSGARRVANVLKPPLANVVRVYLVEGPAEDRNDLADKCDAACGGGAWIVRCPVYRRHVIILSPVPGTANQDDNAAAALRATGPGIAVGAGEAVPLADVATGYEQAFHALALARHSKERFSRFNARTNLEALLRPMGGALWARKALSALLEYTPARPQDPDQLELLATLRSWLDFHAGAARQLTIHRNTLLGRIHHIESILGMDLTKLQVQAEIHLALRLLDPLGRAKAGGSAPELDDMLAAPATRGWAKVLLSPLEMNQQRLGTVRAWVAADARAKSAAAALGVQEKCVRSRLVRAERDISRSLTAEPSARYDLTLALRIRDQQERSAAAEVGHAV